MFAAGLINAAAAAAGDLVVLVPFLRIGERIGRRVRPFGFLLSLSFGQAGGELAPCTRGVEFQRRGD